MNAHNPKASVSPDKHDRPLPSECRQSAETGLAAGYSYRMTDCQNCDTAVHFSGCDECDRGEVEATCINCGEPRPLDDEGECEQCVMGRYLTTDEFQARYLGDGAWRVEL